MSAKKAYHVYVIELNKKVFSENRKFREANPQYNGALECLYVGMTSLTPAQRFMKHKTGAKSKKGHTIASSLVKKYGVFLRPSLYNEYNPLSTKAAAIKMEEELALILRRKGYGVWWN